MASQDSVILNKKPFKINSKYILILAMLYITISLIADTVAYKLVGLGPLIEPGPPFIFPVTYAIGDILAEVYGYSIAKKVIWLGLLCEIIFAVIVVGIIHLPSPHFWKLEPDYLHVLGGLIRFVFAGFLAVLFSGLTNVYTMSKWKIALSGRNFILRSVGSSALGGLILIVIILAVGYSGTVSFNTLLIMFLSIYLLELGYAVILAWPAKLVAIHLKNVEKQDAYDLKTNFNPLSFKDY